MLRAANLRRGPQDEATADSRFTFTVRAPVKARRFGPWGISHSTVSSPDLQSRRREITVPKMNEN